MLLTVALAATLAFQAAPAATASGAAPKPADRALWQKRARQLRQVERVLTQQAGKPAPAGLSGPQRTSYDEQTAWLRGVASQAKGLAGDIDGVLGPGWTGGPSAAAEKMAAMNMQFLALQEATQMESRRFATASNAIKARQDAALHAIRNLR